MKNPARVSYAAAIYLNYKQLGIWPGSYYDLDIVTVQRLLEIEADLNKQKG